MEAGDLRGCVRKLSWRVRCTKNGPDNDDDKSVSDDVKTAIIPPLM